MSHVVATAVITVSTLMRYPSTTAYLAATSTTITVLAVSHYTL